MSLCDVMWSYTKQAIAPAYTVLCSASKHVSVMVAYVMPGGKCLRHILTMHPNECGCEHGESCFCLCKGCVGDDGGDDTCM